MLLSLCTSRTQIEGSPFWSFLPLRGEINGDAGTATGTESHLPFRFLPPEHIHAPMSGTFEYVTAQDKGNVADTIILKTLRWGDCSG